MRFTLNPSTGQPFYLQLIAEVERVADRVCIIDRGRLVTDLSLDHMRQAYRRITLGFATDQPVVDLRVPGIERVRPERAHGSVAFTLALPVRRMRFVVVRAAAGIAQVAALALVPALVVLALSRVVNETYSVSAALQRSSQWAASGTEAFAAALLASVILEPFAALAASLAATFVYAAFIGAPAPLTTSVAAAVAVACAARITERQDF